MSPVGHTLTGVALGYAMLPADASKTNSVAWLSTTACFANFPDLPLPNWGHDRYDISHSIFTTAVCVAIGISLAMLVSRRAFVIPARLIVASALAWFSHLLLDTFYNHGNGLAMLWPLNDGRLALPFTWFSTLRLDSVFSLHNLKVISIEAIAYGLLLTGVVLVKNSISRRQHFVDSPPNG